MRRIIALELMLIAGMLPAFGAAGTTSISSLAIPSALKDIKRGDGACRNDDVAQGEKRLAVSRRNADLKCAITAQELMGSYGKSDTLVVDVRGNAEFVGYHIANALNLSLSELRSKDFLKSKALTLVGSGKGEQELYVACADLTAAGFGKVRVLRGGMMAWLAERQPVDGKAPEPVQLALLTPEELFREASFDANVLMAAPNAVGMNRHAPMAVPISGDTAGAIKAALERRNKELKHSSYASVVLVAGEHYDRAQLAEALATLKPVPVLVYAGSAAVYGQYLLTQKAVWAAHDRGPKQLGCSTK